jgi:AraC-like DNA-binding protein
MKGHSHCPRGALASQSNVSSLTNRPNFRRITPGIETLHSSFSLPRHRHLRAYALVVLAGSLEESGYVGRIRATAGDVLIHPALDCHSNQKVCAGVKLIRLNCSDTNAAGRFYRLNELDELARIAEKDVGDAVLFLDHALSKISPPPPGIRNDWPDLLARTLAQNPSTEIGAWAEANDLAPETVSRGFAAAYGIAPAVFRAELRTRAAWIRITRGTDSLCRIAADTGFADQAHMTRWICRITGAPPGVWRRESSFFKIGHDQLQRSQSLESVQALENHDRYTGSHSIEW